MAKQTTFFHPHLNNGLFADYYLDNIVPALPEWDAMRDTAQAVFDDIKALRDSLQPDRLDEAQLEENYVQPILELLGHHYAVQVKIRYRERGHRKPDYMLMASPAEARAVTNDIYAPGDIQHALAVADAKKWGVPLDKASGGERNPSQQIDEYLRYSELTWGVLTDGHIWRLYHRDTSKYNTYYAVDLEDLIQSDDLDNFLYFYAFFRHNAYTTGWLDKVLAGSEEFAQKLSDKLEDEVYDALEMIAQGYLDYRRNRLDSSPATLREIYEQSLVLLYRLLFIFYAESRDILPMRNDGYRQQRSLSAIKEDVARTLDANRSLNPDSGNVYNRLKDLFFAIDAGDRSLDMPPYNGKLFSAEEHVFLDQMVVGDARLIPALDKLARVDVVENNRHKRVMVDYRDLDVRHLGSIYEKLLEYELDIASQPLTTTSKDTYAPTRNINEAVKKPGEVFLRTGNNERKITGSYYTPDYIVRFIVEKTLEPLLTDITRQYATLNAEGTWQVHDPAALTAAILKLNILDPATGSGHFVVDATAYIAEWLRDLNIAPEDPGDEDELMYWKRQVAGACIYAVDINPLAVELAKLSMWLATLAQGKPLSFLNHHIRAGNSLVGARFDDIRAGELDEASRRSKKRAAKAKEEAVAAGQIDMFSEEDFSAGLRFAVEQMHQIETTIADHIDDVKRQEAMYAALTDRLQGWQTAADVWTARHFGLEVSRDHWAAVRQLTTKNTANHLPPAVQKVVDDALDIAAEQRFFHWELAFPEIFFDETGQPLDNPGFDAVIGNPPYVRQERIQPIKPFLRDHFAVYSGTADLFLYFYERGLEFLKEDHRLGYITSGTYMNSNSAKPFRQYIHDNAGMEWVANFGENQPFRGAEMVYPTIAIMRHGEPTETFNNLFVEGTVPYVELGQSIENGDWVESLSDVTGMDEWRFQAKNLTLLYQKVTDGLAQLGEVINERMYRGVTTGLNEAFIISKEVRDKLIKEHASSSEIIKPLLRGQNLRPWYQINGQEYLIFTRQGIEIEKYPAIHKYLLNFKEALEPKPPDWKGKNWRGRKPGPYKWYEIQDQTAYFEEFSESKIFGPDIGKLPRFSWDESGTYCNDKGSFIVSSKMSLLAVLNSRVVWFVLSQMATPLRLRAGLWQYQAKLQFVSRLPIPDLTAQQESDLSELAETITYFARRRYQLHEDFRETLRGEYGDGQDISRRVALYEWWTLDNDAALNDEVLRRFGTEIPLAKRSEWR
ncbi:MAG: Eco57I restriction-modification methylase domain-containing protein, partial [Chloroflexi bacterium]|nr:Eco57I restriction-modification methylase domain-containing protein [Chloroflexota bacterium]